MSKRQLCVSIFVGVLLDSVVLSGVVIPKVMFPQLRILMHSLAVTVQFSNETWLRFVCPRIRVRKEGPRCFLFSFLSKNRAWRFQEKKTAQKKSLLWTSSHHKRFVDSWLIGKNARNTSTEWRLMSFWYHGATYCSFQRSKSTEDHALQIVRMLTFRTAVEKSLQSWSRQLRCFAVHKACLFHRDVFKPTTTFYVPTEEMKYSCR